MGTYTLIEIPNIIIINNAWETGSYSNLYIEILIMHGDSSMIMWKTKTTL